MSECQRSRMNAALRQPYRALTSGELRHMECWAVRNAVGTHPLDWRSVMSDAACSPGRPEREAVLRCALSQEPEMVRSTGGNQAGAGGNPLQAPSMDSSGAQIRHGCPWGYLVFAYLKKRTDNPGEMRHGQTQAVRLCCLNWSDGRLRAVAA